MKAQKVRVTCLSCNGSALLQIIDDKQVMYIDHTPIISSRFRGDLKIGFECMCGNSSLVCREEKNELDNLVQASDLQYKQSVIKNLIQSLKIKDERKFKVVPV